MLLFEQLKKLNTPENIAKVHIVIQLSDARRPRLTTRDTKRTMNVTVHTMLDNKNIIFASTATEAPPNNKEYQRLSQSFHENEK